MPARGHPGLPRDRGRKAAELYLRAEREHDTLTVSDVATRFGLSRGAVSTAIKNMRRERRQQRGITRSGT